MKTTEKRLFGFLYIILIGLICFSFTSCTPDDGGYYQDCVEFNAGIDKEVKQLRSFDKFNLSTQKEIKRLLDLKMECVK